MCLSLYAPYCMVLKFVGAETKKAPASVISELQVQRYGKFSIYLSFRGSPPPNFSESLQISPNPSVSLRAKCPAGRKATGALRIWHRSLIT